MRIGWILRDAPLLSFMVLAVIFCVVAVGSQFLPDTPKHEQVARPAPYIAPVKTLPPVNVKKNQQARAYSDEEWRTHFNDIENARIRAEQDAASEKYIQEQKRLKAERNRQAAKALKGCDGTGNCVTGPDAAGWKNHPAFNKRKKKEVIPDFNFDFEKNKKIIQNFDFSEFDVEKPKLPTKTVTFKMKSKHKNTVLVKFYTKDDKFTWPSANEAYVLNDSEFHSYSLTCNKLGEMVCYGAWVKGPRTPDSWGCGKDCEMSCKDCCVACRGGTTTYTLAE